MKSLSMFGVSAALTFLMLGGPGAHAQQEIDPDHFDSPNTETTPTPQPRTGNSKVRVIRYRGTFFLPYSALCNGKKLGPGKYSISLRSNGKVGQATFNQGDHPIEIHSVVQTNGPEYHDEAVIVETNKNWRTLSVIRVRGFDFVFDRPHSTAPAQGSKRAERLPLTTVSPSESQTQAASRASSSSKP